MTSLPPPPTPRELAEVCASLSRQIGRARSVDAGWAAFTTAAIDAVDGAEFASISRQRGTHFQTLAPTAVAATDADRLQYELGGGPCIEALTGGGVARTGDIRTDSRWPVYGPRAFAAFGVLSMLSIRMVLDHDDIDASLNLYSRRADAFSETDSDTATLFTAYAAGALSRLIARSDAINLTSALSTARGIGIAIGVLVSTLDVTPDRAFDLLRERSQNTNHKIVDVAAEVTAAGGFPPQS